LETYRKYGVLVGRGRRADGCLGGQISLSGLELNVMLEVNEYYYVFIIAHLLFPPPIFSISSSKTLLLFTYGARSMPS
jgi:hypothetical protein